MTKYKAGDKAIYVRDAKIAAAVNLPVEQIVKVVAVHTKYSGIPYSEPVYMVEWLPTGTAALSERDLRPIKEAAQ